MDQVTKFNAAAELRRVLGRVEEIRDDLGRIEETRADTGSAAVREALDLIEASIRSRLQTIEWEEREGE